mgnify:CR=1
GLIASRLDIQVGRWHRGDAVFPNFPNNDSFASHLDIHLCTRGHSLIDSERKEGKQPQGQSKRDYYETYFCAVHCSTLLYHSAT